jgi:hypothetical protein
MLSEMRNPSVIALYHTDAPPESILTCMIGSMANIALSNVSNYLTDGAPSLIEAGITLLQCINVGHSSRELKHTLLCFCYNLCCADNNTLCLAALDSNLIQVLYENFSRETDPELLQLNIAVLLQATPTVPYCREQKKNQTQLLDIANNLKQKSVTDDWANELAQKLHVSVSVDAH